MRGPGWRFLDLGRRVERGVDDARAIAGLMTGPTAQNEAGVGLALELCDVTSGLSRLPFDLDLGRTIHFVLADRRNPRSLLYQLDRAARHLALLEEMSGRSVAPNPLPALIEAIGDFPGDLPAGPRADGVVTELFERLERAAAALTALSDGITRAFFSQVATSHLTGMVTPTLPFGQVR
jgi:uncharacterized alpha-E superfamily protein